MIAVLARGLPDTFETVSVSVVDAPNLTEEPFSLTSPGSFTSSAMPLFSHDPEMELTVVLYWVLSRLKSFEHALLIKSVAAL